MQRTGLLTTVVVALVLGCIAPCLSNGGILPFPSIKRSGFEQYELFCMQQGWFDNDLVWFIRTDTSQIRSAFDDYSQCSVFWQGLTLAPKLAEAANNVATVYMVLNLQQGPVFTAVPGDPNYSGVWRIVFILYHSDVTPHFISNANPFDPLTNPCGLPPLSDADRILLDSAENPVVVKYPIMAVGPLGGPWSPAPAGLYRIPQGKVSFDYTLTKQVWLPYWFVYCQDPVTRMADVRRVIVPDVFDPPSLPDADKLAPKIGANVAPGLQLIPTAAEENFYFFNPPKPFNQLPVIQACPTDEYVPWLNANFDYSPVMKFVVLDRLIPPSSVINNPVTLERCLGAGKLVIDRDSQVINAPVIPELPAF